MKPLQHYAALPATGGDQVFADLKPLVKDFEFGPETVAVFDDMVTRSVPFYSEIQRMVGELAAEFATEGSDLYDLGCSTGTTLALLDPIVEPTVHFVGIDNSASMLAQARRKLEARPMAHAYELRCADLHHTRIEDASVVIMILTLQFLRPLQREQVARAIRQGMRKGGCLILIEKLITSNTTLNRLFIKYYYELKRRNGYSELEISQKREALENVLIPYRLEENCELLSRSGFSEVEEFFRWHNFSGIVAVA